MGKTIAALLSATLMFGCGGAPPPKKVAPADHEVVYIVEGSTSEASLTYTNETGGLNQDKVKVDWKKSFKAKPGQYVSLSAQNEYKTGELRVKITVDGKTFQEAASNEGYGIASVNGSLPE